MTIDKKICKSWSQLKELWLDNINIPSSEAKNDNHRISTHTPHTHRQLAADERED